MPQGSSHPPAPPPSSISAQVLLQARTRLEEVVDRQLDDAIGRRDQATVLRFARLYKPLGKQVGGQAVGKGREAECGLWGQEGGGFGCSLCTS